jgi:hypothetical protein
VGLVWLQLAEDLQLEENKKVVPSKALHPTPRRDEVEIGCERGARPNPSPDSLNSEVEKDDAGWAWQHR